MKWLGQQTNLDDIDESGYGYCTMSGENGLYLNLVYNTNNSYAKKYRLQIRSNDSCTYLKLRGMNNGIWSSWKTISL